MINRSVGKPGKQFRILLHSTDKLLILHQVRQNPIGIVAAYGTNNPCNGSI